VQVSRGTFYLRGKTWTIGYTVAGKRVREAIGTNRQMAEAVLRKRVIEAIEGRHFNVRNEGRIPFSEFATTYIERCISVLKSVKTERDRVNFWVREFGNRPLGQITHAELQDWQARKRQVNTGIVSGLPTNRLRPDPHQAQTGSPPCSYFSQIVNISGDIAISFKSRRKCYLTLLYTSTTMLRSVMTTSRFVGA
jgi:hypothetical protein